ncbi:MAG: carboxypeptidase M32 [Opitutaceae bacterium]|nr:carboxypeptidase M32 [Opitutaceae bacterium]
MPSTPYPQLIEKLKRSHLLATVSGLLGWDEQVNLPPDSSDQRAEQMSLLAEIGHSLAADPEIGGLLKELENSQATLGADQKTVVRLARRDYDRVTRLPATFVAERARLNSNAYHAWAQARANNDFPGFAPFLERHLEMACREADYLGWGDRPYDYALDKHDPGMTGEVIAALFTELKAGLIPLVAEILASSRKPATGLFRGFPIAEQKGFLREVTERLGFNYRRGRLDVSLHPFCEGSGADVRMTTRFSEDDPLDSLFSSIHETGHGLYDQGLPLSDQGTPLGQAIGMAVHESQSRLWENQVSRSRSFWTYFEPRFRARFSTQTKSLSSDDLYRAINAVEPTLIRVDADEVTYNLHILLRFEIEQRLFRGDVTVRELPAAWNELSSEILGMPPPNDTKGVLQDVHWSGGMFGYFPSYCLGNMIAAQLWFKAKADLPGLEADFASGNFGRLLVWLRRSIHAQGRRSDTLGIVRQVTGEELSPRHLLRYLRERYSPLYLE